MLFIIRVFIATTVILIVTALLAAIVTVACGVSEGKRIEIEELEERIM